MSERAKVRRRVQVCARCRLRKLSCDAKDKLGPCTRCQNACIQCVGFDSGTKQEAPRSLADFLVAHLAKLEALNKSSASQVFARPSTFGLSDNDYSESASQLGRTSKEGAAFTNVLVNQVVQDMTPSFLGVSKTRPLLQCVVRETRLPSKKGPVVPKSQNEEYARAVLNPHPDSGKTLFRDLIPDQVGAFTLLQNYLDRVITQYPIYHRNDVTVAFNSIYHKSASNLAHDSERNCYIVCIIMAISLTTSARDKVQKANQTAHQLVSHAMQWLPNVATNDIPGLQAILLLTQYIFLNPKMADLWLLTGLISQAVIDLGLHQEVPSSVSVHERDLRRCLFWCAWEMEVGVCCIFLRPTSLPTRHIEVGFPLEVDDIAIMQDRVVPGGRVSKFTQRLICHFRRIEAEIVAVLWLNEPLPSDCNSLGQWTQLCQDAIINWRREIYASAKRNSNPGLRPRWTEMCLYANIAYPYILVTLNRQSRRNPNPTTDQMLIAMDNAVKVAEGYILQYEAGAGKIKHVFHPCHHVFNCALIFLRGLRHCKQEVAERWSWDELKSCMDKFKLCFDFIAERWTAAKRCQEEYEGLVLPIEKEFKEFLTHKALLAPPTVLAMHPIAPTMHGMYNHVALPEGPADIDEAYQYWCVFNPTSTSEKDLKRAYI